MLNTPDRRRFLAAAGGAALSARAAAQGREIRSAFIGVGNRGSALLRQTLAQPSVRVDGICDIDAQARDRAQGLAARDNPRSYTDYRQVIDLKDVEAILIGTPCDLHAEMAAAALDAGKYVYCEKPLGITPEQVDRVLKSARRSRAFLQIGQQLRYYPAMREAMRLIHEEKIIGDTYVIKAQRHSTASPKPRPTTWYDDVRRSGDLIVENAVHNIDACNWLAASRPTVAFGHGKKYFPKPIPAGTIMMDGFSVEYIYENDMHLDYSQLYMHPRGLKELANGQWFMIFGEKGAVRLTFSSALLYEMQAAGEPRELISQAIKDARENAMEDFYACIRESRKPFGDIRVAATAALTAIMGREAIYKRRSVTWDELGVSV